MYRHKILFVCVENAGRSQMAEAFFRKYAPEEYQVSSAGTNPSSTVNPIVSQVMKEVGIDLDANKPKSLSNQMIEDSTQAVNMGCMDRKSCPALFVDDVLDWQMSDPKGKSIDEVRKIRDEIELKVKNLIKTLEENSK